jgi:hypothetical protein
MFTYSIPELLSFPLGAWGDNFGAIVRWLGTYLTLPVFILLLVALELTVAWLLRPDDAASTHPTRSAGKKALLVAMWSLMPILAHVILAKTLYARYIVFAIPPSLILVAVLIDRIVVSLARQPSLSRFKIDLVAAAIVVLVMAVPAYQTTMFIFAPQNFNFDTSDRDAYYDRALWAAAPLADRVRAEANGRSATLLTNLGMDAVLIGETAILPRSEKIVHLSPLWPMNNSKIYPFDPYTLQPLASVAVDTIRQNPIFYASVPGEEGPIARFITPLADFPDRVGNVQYRLYTIDFDRYLAWLGQ